MATAAGPAILAYDGSDNARQAIAVAADTLAGRPALVVTVWESVLSYAYRHPMPGDFSLVQDVVEELDRKSREAAESTASEGAELARAAGLEAEPLAHRSDGGVHEALVELANAREASVLVVGSRGRSRLASTLLGSVSYGVLHHTSRPVLLVPPSPAG